MIKMFHFIYDENKNLFLKKFHVLDNTHASMYYLILRDLVHIIQVFETKEEIFIKCLTYSPRLSRFQRNI